MKGRLKRATYFVGCLLAAVGALAALFAVICSLQYLCDYLLAVIATVTEPSQPIRLMTGCLVGAIGLAPVVFIVGMLYPVEEGKEDDS